MAEVSRTAFTELPNGDLTCTITIPFAVRAEVLAGAALTIPLLPGGAVAPLAAPAGDTYTVSITDSALTPPAQTLDVAGMEAPDIAMGTIASWEHVAAGYVREIYMWGAFQLFAKELVDVDAFAAPMPIAVGVIQRVMADNQPDPRPALSALFDRYLKFCHEHNLAPWPPGG